jgi:protocatechuate 3,4-dioxygenase, beta subunit
MNDAIMLPSRRGFLGSLAFGAAAFTTRGAFADELTRTPRIQEGPYYPDKLPLDTDNDLLIINDAITPAVGDVTHLSGRILDTHGDPIRNALVELWQCDRDGIYLKPYLDEKVKYDTNFQGFGRFLTGSTGEYYFRTIKPVPYSGRPAAHIHFKVWKGRKALLTTECFVKGHPGNERDGIYRQATQSKGGQMLPVDFVPVKGSRIGELAAKFDIVLGITPES